MTDQETKPSQGMAEAIELVTSGRRTEASRVLARILEKEPSNVSAWLLLSSVVNDVDRKRSCLQQALRFDPSNEDAQSALGQLDDARPVYSPGLDGLGGNNEPGRIEHEPTPHPQSVDCPICRKDDRIEKVSSIVSSGTSTSSYSGPSTGLAYMCDGDASRH